MAYLDERFKGNTHYWGRLYYTENSVDTTNNTSNITLKLVMFPENSSYSFHGYTNTGHIYINGQEKASGSNSGYVQYGSENVLCSWTGNVAHDNDGSKTIWISFSIDSNFCGNSTDGINFYLTKINRYPVLVSGSNFTDSTNPVFTITAYGTYPLFVKLEAGGNVSVVKRYLSSKNSQTYTLELTSEERKTLRNYSSDGKTLAVRETVGIVNGSSETSISWKDYTMTIVKKPARLKINGNFLSGYPYVRVNGEWKEVKPYIRVNGEWKEEI